MEGVAKSWLKMDVWEKIWARCRLFRQLYGAVVEERQEELVRCSVWAAKKNSGAAPACAKQIWTTFSPFTLTPCSHP